MEVKKFSESLQWVEEAEGKSGPHLLLGNGFSMAFNSEQFSYRALKDRANAMDEIGDIARGLFDANGTNDFESIIKVIESSVTVLESLDGGSYRALIKDLTLEANELKDALAKAIADLHPDTHYDIDDDALRRVGEFLKSFKNVYTTNYDVLLYWVVMNNLEKFKLDEIRYDDGFREASADDDYVVWNSFRSAQLQNVFYLHGALHLFLNEQLGQLQKVTWVRTEEALLAQIRERLAAGSFPLVVTEGTAEAKRSKILQSDYLGRNLRSLANVKGGILVYGLGFSDNDDHLKDAILNSKATRLAVSLYGDGDSESNLRLRKTMNGLVMERQAQVEASKGRRAGLEVQYFSSESVSLWQ